MAGLMDEYLMPGQLSDPAELEKAKYLALMRMGFGMAGREPIGTAIGHGLTTYATMEENARRNADQKMQEMQAKMKYAIEMNKEAQAAKKQQGVMGIVKGLSGNKAARNTYGITDEMLAYAEATGDVAPIMKTMEAHTTKEGDVRMIGNQPFVVRAKDGVVPVMSGGVEVGGVMQPGYLDNLAAREGVTTAARTSNTPQQLGVDSSNRPMFGYPGALLGQPPAFRGQQQGMVQENYSGTPQQIAQARAIADADMARQGITRGMAPAQQAQETELSKMFGDVYTAAVKAELGAPASIAKYRRLGDLYSNVSTSKVYPAIAQVKSVAAGLFPDAAKNWTADLPPAQAAEAISRGMALELRNPASGMGMPGAMSDADREFLRSMVPNWELDPRSIPLMVEAKILLHEREMQVGKLARAYRKEHGIVDEGLIQVLSDYSEKNPLFDGLAKKAERMAPSPSSVAPSSPVIRYDKNGRRIE